MDNSLKCFTIKDKTEKLHFDTKGFSHNGFIISPKYDDNTIYLPIVENGDHSKSLYFTISKLFKEEKHEFYELYSNTLKETLTENTYFLDKDEITYSSFLTCYNSIVFLNTGDEYFNSGVLFIPEDESLLSNTQKEKINEVVNYLIDEDELTSRICIVPKMNSTVVDFESIRDYSIREYSEMQNKSKAL